VIAASVPGAVYSRGSDIIRVRMVYSVPLHRGQEFDTEVIAQLRCHVDGEPPRRLNAAGDRGDGRVMTDREQLNRVGAALVDDDLHTLHEGPSW
jgi:hypothetical protein